MKQPDTYKEVKTIYFENAVARVHIPDITPEERERRMKDIGRAAGQLILSLNNKN